VKLFHAGLLGTLALAAAVPARAALDLSTYSMTLQRGIDFDEASGVAYNYDRDVLFVIDDEGDDAAEFSLAGTKLTADRFQSNYRDLEGVTYVGGGRYVLADERTETLALIGVEFSGTRAGLPSNTYTGTNQARKYAINGGANVGNNGLEGVAFDPITGTYFGVKQGGLAADGTTVAQRVYQSQVTFGTPSTGVTTQPFDPAPLGLGTLSDVAVLAQNPNFAGTDYYGNLLLLSADPSSRRLIEVTRTGQLLSSLDLSALQIQTIEGVTLDRAGNIYLVGETGGVTPGSTATSGLVVLSRSAQSAVPEPATWTLLLSGFAMVGAAVRRPGRAQARMRAAGR